MCGQFSFSRGGASRRPHALPGRGPGLRPGVAAFSRRRLPAVRVLLASALPLLVPRVGADDHDPAVPTDDPALAADLLDARLDLHGAGSIESVVLACCYLY